MAVPTMSATASCVPATVTPWSMHRPYSLARPTSTVYDLGPTSMVFRQGHCIRLTVSSSNFPAYARNLNTSGAHHEASEPRPALQTVLHDAAYPSCLLVPVIPR